MPLRVSFELSDRDLKYFRRKMREATSGSKNSSEAKVIASTLERHGGDPASDLQDLVAADASARRTAVQILSQRVGKE